MSALRVVAGCVLAAIAAALLSFTGPKPQFTEDGYDYAIAMLVDTGLPYAQAQARAQRFFATQPIAKLPLFAKHLRGTPEYWNLFSVRRVYPWVASLLYPYRGFDALVDVSRAAYVATAVLALLLALRFAPLGYGLLLSVALSAFPPWRDIARDALTDPLAIALCSAALFAAALAIERRTWWRIAAFALLCALLTFTRPIPYILLGAGIVAAVAAPRKGERTGLVSAAWITGIAALCAAAVEVALAQAHAPSFRWIVQDTYAHFVARGYAPAGESLRRFFLTEEATIALHMAVKGVESVVPVLAVAGMFLRRRHPAMPLLAGACAATWFGALVDPDRFDIVRCVVMPVAPALAAFAAAALADAVTFVPARLGLPAPSLRLSLPRRVLVRNTTVKE